MLYEISHQAEVEADSEEEAKQAYLELWQSGFYDKLDLDIKEIE